MDRPIESVEPERELPHNNVTLDLNDVDKTVGFAVMVFCRLSYFSLPDAMPEKDKERAAFNNLDRLFAEARKQLRDRLETFKGEHDNLRDSLQRSTAQADSSEQVGREEHPDSQV